MIIHSLRSNSGEIERITTDTGVTLERAVPNETIKKGDWLLYVGREPYQWKPSSLIEVDATSLIGDPICYNRWGFRDILRKGEYLHFVEAAEPVEQVAQLEHADGDLVVITAKTFAMKGFEVGDIVEVTKTDVAVLHDYMVTRYDGAVGFLNGDMVRPANDGERNSFYCRRVLLKVGRHDGEPQVGDIVQVNRGEYEGTLARIEKTCINDLTVKLRGVGWLPLRHVDLVAPTEATTLAQ